MSILSDDQIDLIRKKEVTREKDAARKREERRVKREAKLKAKAVAEAKKNGTVPFIPVREWWAQNRATLTETQRQELAARQEIVLDQMWWAQAWIAGTYDVSPADEECYVGLELGVEILLDDIKQYGTVCYYSKTQMFAQEFRTDPEFRSIVRREEGRPIFFGMNATEISLRYGYLVAIPTEITCNPMMQAVKRKRQCGECGVEVGELTYQITTVYCPDCTVERERRVKADVSKAMQKLLVRQLEKQHATQPAAHAANVVFDKRGPWDQSGDKNVY